MTKPQPMITTAQRSEAAVATGSNAALTPGRNDISARKCVAQAVQPAATRLVAPQSRPSRPFWRTACAPTAKHA